VVDDDADDQRRQASADAALPQAGGRERSVVILPDDAWGAWLRAKSEGAARALLQGFDAAGFMAGRPPRIRRAGAA
jgi:hypothetical protein